MSQSRADQLRQENHELKQRIQQLQNHRSNNDLQAKINTFVTSSKQNLADMQKKIAEEHAQQNQLLHTLTSNYEATLKKQIQLLNINKQLTQQKDQQQQVFNEGVEKLTSEYEGQIKDFEKKVKANVKRIQDLSNGGNLISRLLGNEKFREVMKQRGCSLEALENQCKLEAVSEEVEEREKQINQAEEKSVRLDEELSKMHQLIDTMKNLLENMMKEKDNILKQNSVLREKLQQSEELIGKLLAGAGAGANIAEEDEQEDEEGQEEEEEEGQEETKEAAEKPAQTKE